MICPLVHKNKLRKLCYIFIIIKWTFMVNIDLIGRFYFSPSGVKKKKQCTGGSWLWNKHIMGYCFISSSRQGIATKKCDPTIRGSHELDLLTKIFTESSTSLYGTIIMCSTTEKRSTWTHKINVKCSHSYKPSSTGLTL